nr:fibroblast growth factor 1 isoform X3 [Nothobranchius furzeri]
MDGEETESPPRSSQVQEHCLASTTPSGMSEGEVTVFQLVPVTPDLSKLGQRSLIKLYCRNGGHHLRILPDGTVNGGTRENDPYANTERRVLLPGEFRREQLQHVSLSEILLVCCLEEERSAQTGTVHPLGSESHPFSAKVYKQRLNQNT